ncbi:hypothetical protein [Amycolatopsis saalfeldensis]|uniref:Uncharacterized protein n=1 Tax=Amycolatopsis saalfeldensis TaxID=394193 RepID=A0A1H8Y8R7_9PSEU|nr:hypothetical protein [Amycolatopsis saalfeldensis]SEP48492.1 hypothetical protein SAMN04489732_11253 [Amycolatopsis saalfeldensis]
MVATDVIATQVVRALTTTVLQERGGLWQSPRGRLKKRLREAIGTAPDEPLGVLESLMAHADLSAFDARRASVWWGRAYYVLGVPAVILAATAGATGLATTTGRVVAAIIALVSAGLTAAATFLNSGEQRKSSDRLSAAWQELADDARLELLRRAQALKSGKTAEDVLGFEYWNRVLHLQRRKGRLLRGDLVAEESGAVQQTSNRR